VRELARACRHLGAKLVHFSTDYVFGLDTARTTPLTETDPPGPVSVYGLSKLAGEYLVRSTAPRNLVIRTCGLYGVWGSGGKGGNFVETMLRVAGQGKPLRVVNDQRCTPSYTVDVATAAAALIAAGAEGLFHVTSGGECI
jgi:dTDP-4-dehydrorhamnose reductase